MTGIVINSSLSTYFDVIKEYLINDSSIDNDLLFSESVICMSILRGLSPINIKILLYNILTPSSKIISRNDFNKLAFKIDKLTDPQILLNELISLKIIKIITETEDFDNKNLLFHTIFLKNLKLSVYGTSEDTISDTKSYTSYFYEKMHCDKIDNKPSDLLANYFNERWEFFLSFIADTAQISNSISNSILSILVMADILKISDNDSSTFNITSHGFQFLLMSSMNQCVIFLYYTILWMKLSLEVPVISTLTFISLLSQQISGTPISKNVLFDDNFSSLLKILREIGLIFMKNSKVDVFYTVPLLSKLTSYHSEVVASQNPAYIIVESNFRIYGYNISKLMMSLIGLFAEIRNVFPCMIVCRITRESIHQAFSFGIGAEQILNFLQHYMNVFTSCKNITGEKPPSNVMDQIKLWEKERNRLKWTPGVLYSNFNSVNDFEDISEFASENGFLVLQNKNRKMLIVTEDSHAEMKRFWKEKKRK